MKKAASPIIAGRMNRAHGFIFIKDSGPIPLISCQDPSNDPRRGMNVIICAWVKPTDGQLIKTGSREFAICHHSLN